MRCYGEAQVATLWMIIGRWSVWRLNWDSHNNLDFTRLIRFPHPICTLIWWRSIDFYPLIVVQNGYWVYHRATIKAKRRTRCRLTRNMRTRFEQTHIAPVNCDWSNLSYFDNLINILHLLSLCSSAKNPRDNDRPARRNRLISEWNGEDWCGGSGRLAEAIDKQQRREYLGTTLRQRQISRETWQQQKS